MPVQIRALNDKDDYLIYAGIRILLPEKAHDTLCPLIAIEADLPIRKNASHDIKTFAECARNDILRIAQNCTITGRTATDQREWTHTIETRIKTVIGNPYADIPEEPGWYRKYTGFHDGLPKRAKPPEQPDEIQIEAMEIDFDQAPPEAAIYTGTGTTTKQEAVQEACKDNAEPSTSMARRTRPRSNTAPTTTIPRTTAEDSDDKILLRRRHLRPRDEKQLQPEAGPSKRPGHRRAIDIKQEAQQEAESVRFGNL